MFFRSCVLSKKKNFVEEKQLQYLKNTFLHLTHPRFTAALETVVKWRETVAHTRLKSLVKRTGSPLCGLVCLPACLLFKLSLKLPPLRFQALFFPSPLLGESTFFLLSCLNRCAKCNKTAFRFEYLLDYRCIGETASAERGEKLLHYHHELFSSYGSPCFFV